MPIVTVRWPSMVGQATARHFWPREDAIGKHMLMGHDTLTIVGVVPDTRYHDLREAPPSTISRCGSRRSRSCQRYWRFGRAAFQEKRCRRSAG